MGIYMNVCLCYLYHDNLTPCSDTLRWSPGTDPWARDRGHITIDWLPIGIFPEHHITHPGKRPHLSLMCMSWDDEINRIIEEDSMQCWLMFEEDYWLILRECQFIELWSQISCCLGIMIRDSSKSYTIENNFFIIEDIDIPSLHSSDHRIGIAIFFMISIREINSVRCMNPSKYLCYSYIIRDRTIVEISWDEDYLRIQRIDRIDKFLCMFFPIDIPIVRIRYEDDVFLMPGMISWESDSISHYPRSETCKYSDDIEEED